MEKQYKVEYENETIAFDPLGAVKNMVKYLASTNNSGGRCFTVTELGTNRKFSVDLDEEDHDAVTPI